MNLNLVGKVCYWKQNTKNYPLFKQLWEERVPFKGKCDTYLGELIRAVGKINYVYYEH